MRKISIFGPRETLPSRSRIEVIARGISTQNEISEIASGGVVGFPTEVIKLLGRQSSPRVRAYTPCSDESEWREYQEKGLAPDRTLFDEIIWTPKDVGEIKEKALYRIPFLIKDSKTNLAYLNGQGNTNLEVLLSLALSIPTLCLVDNPEEEEEWEELYRQISRESRYLEVYSDPQRLMYEFERKVKC